MGGTDSGKTTIAERMKNPHITEYQLKELSTTTKAQDIIKCDRIPYKNKDLYPYLYDNPGNSCGKMVDAINKYGLSKSDNKVIIYVISFIKSESGTTIDQNMINSQISKAAILVKIFKTSESLKKVQKIIVFFNKCDLLYDSEMEFYKNIEKIEQIYKSSTDYDELRECADTIIYGSALKGWGISELKNEMIKLRRSYKY